MIREGKDPKTELAKERQTRKAEAAAKVAPTFREVVDLYLTEHLSSWGTRNTAISGEKQWTVWRRPWGRVVLPISRLYR